MTRSSSAVVRQTTRRHSCVIRGDAIVAASLHESKGEASRALEIADRVGGRVPRREWEGRLGEDLELTRRCPGKARLGSS
jgi:hypothetical protein